jgi:broad specificity phosphatase PhoE
MARHPGQTVAVISHGGPIRLCVEAIEGYPLHQLGERAVPIGNTSVTVLQEHRGRYRLLAIADSSHLEDARLEEDDFE